MPSRPTTMLGAGVLGVLTVLVVVLLTRNEESPALRPVIAIDGWAPYWALDDSAGEISRRAGSMREVSPFWFNVTGATQIEPDRNAPEKLTKKFLKNTRDAAVVPSIVDKLPAGEMAAILADPVTRQRHVETIVAFARNGNYDGIDVNYEQFAFADGRDTWETTRPNWVSFVAELAERLRSDGRTLTVSVPVVYDDGRTSESGYWVYDYDAIVEHVDHIRMMVYDYSVQDPGPIAPLDFVRRSIKGAIEATDRPEKLVLAVPVYGRNWPVSTTGVCPQPDENNGISVPGKTTVTARSVDDLIERRNATPIYDPVTAEWSFEYELEITDGSTTCVQTRRVHYVDANGVRARMDMAIEFGLGGVAVWALGFDDDDVWDAILIDGTLPNLEAQG
jgi:spore germination protein YaaH